MSGTLGDDDNGWACAVCAEPVSVQRLGGDVVAWLHPGDMPGGLPHMASDHVAVPVRAEEVQTQTRCDFCSGPNPRWVLPVDAFKFDEDREVDTSRDWLACEVCARLLKKDRWAQVTERGVRALAAKYGVNAGDPRLSADMEATHAKVREHQTGPVRRIG